MGITERDKTIREKAITFDDIIKMREQDYLDTLNNPSATPEDQILAREEYGKTIAKALQTGMGNRIGVAVQSLLRTMEQVGELNVNKP